ncbi:hypothetical protein ON010_g12763 [Phytophthora cinnamomi]|nr:hypothetical protein ON010_g12763 [Phytophthora cinnamomi]
MALSSFWRRTRTGTTSPTSLLRLNVSLSCHMCNGVTRTSGYKPLVILTDRLSVKSVRYFLTLVRGSRPRSSAPEPSRGAPRRVAVVANPDDQEFPFREIVEERLTTEGAFLLVDWESSYVPVGNVHPDLVREFRNERRNGRADFRNISQFIPTRGRQRGAEQQGQRGEEQQARGKYRAWGIRLTRWERSRVVVNHAGTSVDSIIPTDECIVSAEERTPPKSERPTAETSRKRTKTLSIEDKLQRRAYWRGSDSRGSRPRSSAPEPSRGAPRRVAVVANPDDQEFPFREIVEERLTTEGAFLLVDWESSYVPVGNVHPDLVREFRNERRNGRADFRNISQFIPTRGRQRGAEQQGQRGEEQQARGKYRAWGIRLTRWERSRVVVNHAGTSVDSIIPTDECIVSAEERTPPKSERPTAETSRKRTKTLSIEDKLQVGLL